MNDSPFHPIPRKTTEPSGIKPVDASPRKLAVDSSGTEPANASMNIPQKPVICFECGRISLVPQAAISARCHHCSSYINLADISIHSRSYRTVAKTRGNVLVKEGTQLSGITIEAHHLTLIGRISGNFTCTGDCIIKGDQHILGRIQTRRFILERKTNATLVFPVVAQSAVIAGTFNGTLLCQNSVVITKTGKVLGDINCPNLEIEEGGIHVGRYTQQMQA